MTHNHPIAPDPVDEWATKVHAATVTANAINAIRHVAEGKAISSPNIRGVLRSLHDCTYCFTIINGYGGSGKDTFVDMCRGFRHTDGISPDIYEASSIDPVRNMVTQITKYSTNDCGKTDRYRALLSEIKRAWIKFSPDGPTNYLLSYVSTAITNFQYFDKFIQFGEILGLTPSIYDPISPDTINSAIVLPRMHFFFHVREKDEIDKLAFRLRLTYPHAQINRLLITGRRADQSGESSNDSDRNVEGDDMRYDYMAYNIKDLTGLRNLAHRYLNICDYEVADRIYHTMME